MELPQASPLSRRAFFWLAPAFFVCLSLGFALDSTPKAATPAPDSTLRDLIVVALLVLANGFFVASEFALVAVRKTRIDQLAAEGSGAAVVVQKSLKNIEKYIAATQVGITIASLVLGSVGERTFHGIFESLFAFLPSGRREGAFDAVSVGLAYFVMTALHVIIGELMPKSIALQSPEKVSLFTSRPMTLIVRVFAPLIWLLNRTGQFLLRCLVFALSRDMVLSIRPKNWICWSRSRIRAANSTIPKPRFCTAWYAFPT